MALGLRGDKKKARLLAGPFIFCELLPGLFTGFMRVIS